MKNHQVKWWLMSLCFDVVFVLILFLFLFIHEIFFLWLQTLSLVSWMVHQVPLGIFNWKCRCIWDIQVLLVVVTTIPSTNLEVPTNLIEHLYKVPTNLIDWHFFYSFWMNAMCVCEVGVMGVNKERKKSCGFCC